MRVYSFDYKEVIPLRRCLIVKNDRDKGVFIDKDACTKSGDIKYLGEGYFAYECFHRYVIVDTNGKKYHRGLFSDIPNGFRDGILLVRCVGNHDALKTLGYDFCNDETYQHSSITYYCNYLKPDMKFISTEWFYASGCCDFRDGYAAVKGFDGNFFYINKEGKDAFNKEFDLAEPFENGTALVRGFKEQNFGYNLINTKGKLLIKEETWPTDIDEHTFVNGFLIVKKKADNHKSESDKVYNYVSKKTGKYLSNIWFNHAENFKRDGFAKIIKLWLLYVDEEGNYHAEKKKGYHNKGVLATYIDKYGNLYDEDKNPLPNKFIEFLNKK